MSFFAEPGNLRETPLAAILIEALNLRASGVLEVAHGGGTSQLWFRDGRPVGAQVFAGFKPLGMMLLQAGLIDIDALSRSLALMAENKRPQGEILIELGVISAADVARVLEEQQSEYVALIASLDEGSFAFDGARPIPEWTRTSRLSPVKAIVDALERPQASGLVAATLEPISPGLVRLSCAYPEVAAAFRWTDADRSLVSRLEGGIAFGAFFSGAPVPAGRARAILAGLLLLGLAAPQGAIGIDEQTGGIAIAQEDVVPSPAPEPSAGPARGEPAPPARRVDPAEARARRQRLLQQAMRNMGVGPFGGRAGAAGPSGPAPGRSGASATEAELREALLAIAPRAREKDLFARLGVQESASREDVKVAFLAIARRFHPDHFGASALADLQDTVRDFFAAINEAYEVLSDDRRRTDYLSRRRAPDKAHDSGRIDFLKGEACLRSRDYARAIGFLESAVRADPRPAHQAALAWAVAAGPARDRQRARSLLASALRDPSCDLALHVAGLLARDEGDAGTAERHFRAAVKVNPKNADAVRELRLLEARRAEERGR